MKQLEDIIKDRLDDYELKLPSMDQQSFWSTKAVRERAAKRRRSYLGVAVGLPAAAAIFLTVMLSIHFFSPVPVDSEPQSPQPQIVYDNATATPAQTEGAEPVYDWVEMCDVDTVPVFTEP